MQGTWRHSSARGGARLVLAAAAALLLVGREAGATIRYGDIQISGNVETQNLVRVRDQFKMYPVQQRNTARLQYEHVLVNNGKILGGELVLPFIEKADFFAYYRGVYDSIYDIAPGGLLRTQDGGRAGKISDIPASARWAIAHENNLREIYLDVKMHLPVSFRIGRQQIVWGNTLTPGVMDTVNTVDASWHASQESGLLGRVGFSELRIPFWAAKMLISLGSIGPFSNTFIEAYDSPFEFNPTDTRQYPAPWSLPFLNPVRPGITADLSAAAGAPPGTVVVQPCFDLTDNPEPNGGPNTPTSGPNDIFANTAKTGLCNSINKRQSRVIQGLYDRHDPTDVNQFGVRVGSTTPFGLDFTFAYIYRRSSGADIFLNVPTKAQIPAVTQNPTGFLLLDAQRGAGPSHTTFDPIFKENSTAIGYLRVPLEFYYPYIHTIGSTMSYYEDFTQIVYNLELAYRMNVPVPTLDSTKKGMNKKDTMTAQLLLDRQTWIRPLNSRSTFTTLFQTTVAWDVDHEGVNATGTTGDVGIPNSALIHRGFGALDRIDKVKEFEYFSLFAITNFYRGGTIAPLLGIISDWANAPSMEYLFLCDFYLTNNFFIEGQGRIFTNFGRNVDEPFGIGRYSQNDEFGLKATYQF